MSSIKVNFYRVIFKCLTVIVAIRSMLRCRFPRDPTLILLNQFTERQKNEERYAALDLQDTYGRRGDRLAPSPSPSPSPVRLLIVIPFRDQWSVTECCLNSLLKQKVFHLEVKVLLANNQSTEPKTRLGIDAHNQTTWPAPFSVVEFHADYPFNFSKINNDAVRAFCDYNPQYILFLNNDIELMSDLFLSEMVSLAQRLPNLGALGCSLLYPDLSVQHLFLAPGVKIVGAHPLKGIKLNLTHQWFQAPRPVPAVTGAVMLVSMEAFLAAGGFDEALSTLGQDLDLCLKLQKLGRVNWVATQTFCIHHEGRTRGKAIDRHQVEYIYEKWGDSLTSNAYFSPEISRWSEYPLLSWWEGKYPWHKVI